MTNLQHKCLKVSVRGFSRLLGTSKQDVPGKNSEISRETRKEKMLCALHRLELWCTTLCYISTRYIRELGRGINLLIKSKGLFQLEQSSFWQIRSACLEKASCHRSHVSFASAAPSFFPSRILAFLCWMTLWVGCRLLGWWSLVRW